MGTQVCLDVEKLNEVDTQVVTQVDTQVTSSSAGSQVGLGIFQVVSTSRFCIFSSGFEPLQVGPKWVPSGTQVDT